MEDVRLWLAEIVDSSDDPIISKNLDGVILTWNLAAQRLFGYSTAEAVGQPITIIIPPELRDEEKEILRRLRAGERIEHHETRRITRNGRYLDVSLTHFASEKCRRHNRRRFQDPARRHGEQARSKGSA